MKPKPTDHALGILTVIAIAFVLWFFGGMIFHTVAVFLKLVLFVVGVIVVVNIIKFFSAKEQSE